MRLVMDELGVPKKKIADIMFGINTEIFNDKKRELPATEFVITSTRNFEKVYNHEQFIRAVAKIRDKIPALKVIMAGDGSMKQEMMDLAAGLGLEGVISFRGKLPQQQIVEILNSTHVFVTVSLSDGNALSLLEAMACGAYPVASDIPANREWVKEGINGNFVAIGDVDLLAERLLEAFRNYASLSAKAKVESERVIAEKGTWQVNMDKMEKNYKKLAGNGK
jgi:glycosyltransferase involved in cell wall biosynthesis